MKEWRRGTRSEFPPSLNYFALLDTLPVPFDTLLEASADPEDLCFFGTGRLGRSSVRDLRLELAVGCALRVVRADAKRRAAEGNIPSSLGSSDIGATVIS